MLSRLLSHDMPRSTATGASTARASSYEPAPVAPRSRPWSATAASVGSGIVLTVPGATSSTTYWVSSYFGSLTPVEAQSGRCGLAPAASRAFQRSEEKTSSYAW
mgnify:CR=1 FL=1